jgi:hypothetical protein
MRIFLILILTLSAFNVFSNETKKTENNVRNPSSSYSYVCNIFKVSYPDERYQTVSKILNEKCDPDRYTQVFLKNDVPDSFCCVSK